ncbi:uncharacterized protein LOC126965483 [Leptidea sinapis]|uniref:uncharacterized protein LOC126965483 n=1 Tax=Leptidea sinapis TaxID=189913 RepID=UPI0021C2B179|nr:uncharacterized protein LOC126965483 [Leptidea sinapis]
MNKVNFNKWLREKLIPNLPPQSIVVMDNASYHTVQVDKAPTMSSTKSEMQSWITSKGLSYLPTMLKAQLYEIIKEHKQLPVYEADVMLEENGHKVLRLPPYHCDLNPIELIWSVLKRRVAEKNVGQEANKIVHITEEEFATITAEEWNKECEHVIKMEDQYCADGPVIDSETERFIIEVGEDTDTSDDSDAEDNNMSDLDEHNYCKKL